MPAWNPVTGHLLVAGKIVDGLPPSAHNWYMMRGVSKSFPNGAFYFDAWPMMEPMLIIHDPVMTQQVTSHPGVGATKPAILKDWFYPITAGPSLFDHNGQPWKYLHSMFSPGFSNNNIMQEVPVMVDRTLIYRDILRQKAKQDECFELEPLALNLILDIIGEVLLNIKLDHQRKPHPLAETMVQQLKLKFTYTPQNLLACFSPFLKYKMWSNSRRLDKYIRDHLEQRFQAYRSNKPCGQTESFRSVMDLAIEHYMSQPGKTAATTLDAEFLSMATRNMRMFFFAGYDSTASSLVYAYHNLWTHPETLARMCQEHDEVFGPDVDAVPQLIRENPTLVNSLPYTLAVIKESMRLFPVAGGILEGSADLVVVDAEGNKYPTKDFSVLISHYNVQRNPRYWPRPNEFLPERWLVEPHHELYPPKGGWRVFEHGPRLCIGQQLVMTEIKTILACTARSFEIRHCYAELDGDKQLDLSGVDDSRAYMFEHGAAHPVGGYPCRVSLSDYVPGQRKQ